MEYKINPGAYSEIFPVPSAIVDENIRLASVVQLKVILYMLRNSSRKGITASEIASSLFMNEEDVSDAMVFWRERGILLPEKEEAFVISVSQEETIPEKIPAPAEKSIEKKLSDIPISRPSHEQIAARLSESEEISLLLTEAQQSLGKTIGYDGQSVLIMMYDSYGLPAEVILMAIEYAKSQGKKSFSSIAKIGKIWSELEIDSIEGASQYIEEHNDIYEVWNSLRSLTDISNKKPTQKQYKYLTAWVKEYGYDVNIIFYAYEESVDRTGKMSLPYMDKIITSWHKNKVKTPLDIEKQRKLWQESHSKEKPKKESSFTTREASYDIDKFLSKGSDLIYDKKDKNQ